MGGLEPGVGVPDTGGIGVVPGARFDPYGPPGVPGFERNRFARCACSTSNPSAVSPI
jgi:proteasome inhibitor subunit 1 (PI31)